MSLTSFIKISPVKAVFRKEFPLKQIKLEGKMKAEPVTRNFPLVGTAFDYLFRFFLEQENQNCISKSWVAENSLILLEQAIKKSEKPVPKNMIEASEKMISYMQDAKKIYGDYLRTGEINDDLIRSSIILAQMDVLYRSGKMHPELGKVDQGDIQDLRNLISLVDPEMFRAKNACYLNPTFGYGSELVDGADADLIVDDALIDVKTTKFLSFTQDHYNQLIGYYILSKLGEINESENIPISTVGIYFSRHGVLHTIPTDQIENHPNFTKFVNWFEKSASAIFTEKLKSIS